jgi:hypothetical protein
LETNNAVFCRVHLKIVENGSCLCSECSIFKVCSVASYIDFCISVFNLAFAKPYILIYSLYSEKNNSKVILRYFCILRCESRIVGTWEDDFSVMMFDALSFCHAVYIPYVDQH